MTTELHYNAPVRNCANCVHCSGKTEGYEARFMRCHRTGNYCDIEMEFGRQCGIELRLWQPKPPAPLPEPQVGIFVRLWRWLFGAPTPAATRGEGGV